MTCTPPPSSLPLAHCRGCGNRHIGGRSQHHGRRADRLYRGNWPPPKLDRMRAASLAGFPEINLVVRPDRSAAFNAYGALPAVEGVTDSEIIFT
jgi:hypothetical protein